jgi:lipopolysaccharide export system permease protein
MRLLDRYLLRELLVPLGYCLCGFLLLWISADLFSSLRDFQEKKMLAVDILEYYLVMTPGFLILVLPIALLLACLYALTNHARHNEITAMRAAGLSLWRLSLPFFVVGFVASIALFAVNEFWVPGTSERAEQINMRRVTPTVGPAKQQQFRQFGFTNEREGRRWLIGVYDTRTAEMVNPVVTWTQSDGSGRTLHAQRARRVNGVWTFYGVTEFRLNQNNEPPVPLLQTNVLAMPQFEETPEQIHSENTVKSMMNSVGKGAKKPDIPISEILNYLRLHPNPSQADANWLYTKLHGRLAAPWTCLVVVVIALPFGAVSGRRNVFVGVASSILICFGYFVLQLVGLALGVTGDLPPWLGAWFPNLAFGITGLWLTARVR